MGVLLAMDIYSKAKTLYRRDEIFMLKKLKISLIVIGLSIILLSSMAYGEDIIYYTQDTTGLPEITKDERNAMDDTTDSVVQQDIMQFANRNDDFTAVFTINSPSFTFNGISREIDPGRDTKAMIKDGRTLVPIKAFIDELGGKVDWDNDEKKVTISIEDKIIAMWIGSYDAYYEIGDILQETKLDVPPVIINGRTMVPLSFVSTNLGFTVDWNANAKTVTIKN